MSTWHALVHQPLDERRARTGDRGHPTEVVVALDDAHGVAPPSGHSRRLQPGHATADHDDLAGRRRGLVPVGILGLPPAGRFPDAGDDRVACVAHLAGLVAADARSNPLRCPGAQLGDEVGVGDLRPGHLHRVGDAVVERPGRLADVDDRALEEHRRAGDGAHRPAQLDVEPRRLVEVRPRLLHREDRATHNDEVVDAQAGEIGRQRRGLLRRDPGPRRQLVARQAQPDDGITGCGAHRGDDVAGQALPILAPFVVALVGQPAEELAHQAVLAGVDLHPVAAGAHCPGGRRGEAVDDGADVGGLHPLGHFAGVDLRHPRRGPQLALAVRAGALAAGVVERGDHQCARWMARLDDRTPSVGGA